MGRSQVKYIALLSAIMLLVAPAALAETTTGQGADRAGDTGILSIDLPTDYQRVDVDVFPYGTVKNFGASDVTADFDVTCVITDASLAVVYADTIVHTGTMVSAQTDPVTFTEPWHPTELGEYTVTMTTLLAGDEQPVNDSLQGDTEVVPHYGAGGPDAFGYRWIDSDEPDGPVYDWIEISDTGTSTIMYGVPTFHGDDNFSEPIPLGFTFPFYGYDRTHMYVDTNGEILLAENNWYEPYPDAGWNDDGFIFNYVYPIPGYSYMPALVSPYWDDLEAFEGISDVYFQTFGVAPDRYCVVEWHDFGYNYGASEDTTLTFEAIFHENGDIVFQYQNVNIGHSGSATLHDNGASSTVAIQNDAADAGLCYLREITVSGQYLGVDPPGNLLTDGLAILFFAGTDEQPPVFSYEEIGNTFNSTPATAIMINDMSTVLTDSLYYNYGEGWMAVSHSSFEAPNIYHYVFSEIPIGRLVEYYFVATDGSVAANRGMFPIGAPEECYSFRTLPTHDVEVLLAHPGTVPGYQDYENIEFPEFVMALDAADVVYDIYNWAEHETYRFADKYSTIFVYANSASASAENDSLAVALMEFLDGGTNGDPKNIFFASDGLATSQHAYPNSKPITKFFQAYIRGTYVPDGTVGVPPNGGTDGIGGPYTYDYSHGSVIGWAGSPIGDDGVELPVYSNSPDVIVNDNCPDWYADEVENPEIWSWASFSFQDGPIGGYAYAYELGAGIWLDNLIYKSFFMTFDLSQFTSEADRKMLIQDAVDWFGISTGIDEPGDEVSDVRSSLSQNRPNPFNPTTTIAYNIAQPGDVLLEIYNVAGQRMRTLVDERRSSGPHEVMWDGRNDHGESVGSGIYFYRIMSDEFTSMKKMILLK